MRQLASACTARLDELQAAVEDERVARLEREGKLLERFSRDVLRVHERIDAERASRATAVSEITRVCADAMAMARNAASVASEEQVQGQDRDLRSHWLRRQHPRRPGPKRHFCTIYI